MKLKKRMLAAAMTLAVAASALPCAGLPAGAAATKSIESQMNWDTVTISGIPAGTYYRVTELSTQGYHVTVNGNEGYIVSGTMETGAIKPASFVNTPYYELPSTGGAGTGPYITGGLLLTAAASVLLLYNHIKRRKEDTAFS